MKEYLFKKELNKDVVEYIQAAFEDYKAKQDLISMIFEIHKYDEDESIVESKPFAHYEKEFAKAKVKYDTAMQELRTLYIPEQFQSERYRFEVDFEENILGIY